MQSLFLTDDSVGFATDLYQLTMAAGYHVAGRDERATFELFVRRLPRDRGYLVAAGLEQALHGLAALRFDAAAISYLQAQPSFASVPGSFFDQLSTLRFTGDVDAMPEGTPFFPDEPVLRVTAPLIEAQLVETYLLSVINYQTLVATKAHRVVRAAQGRGVADFGTRRAHGPQAGVYAARASYIAGALGTSNVLAGQRLGIPIVGTAAHSWTMTFGSETDAFGAYHRTFPEHSTLLVDTYDTLEGTRRAIAVAGEKLRGIRLDSGDLGALAKATRAILDEAGLTGAKIVASSDLNEYKIAELLASGAPIDLFGVGTEMVTSRDDPTLSGVYKIVEIAGEPRVKCAPGKSSYAGRKQVWRGADGDIVGLVSEAQQGEPLLVPLMREGALAGTLESLDAIRERCATETAKLPEGVMALRDPAPYPVTFSEKCQALTAEAAAKWGDV